MQLYSYLKPPGVVAEARRTTGRVRLEMMGGASGRNNMLPLAGVRPADQSALPELKTGQN